MSLPEFKSIPHIIFSSAENFPEKAALCHKVNGSYKEISYKKLAEMIRELSAGLISIGLNRGDKIAVLGESSYRWAIADISSMAADLVVVPVYPSLTPVQMEYILNDSQTRAVFLDSAAQYDKIIEIKEKVPSLNLILSLEDNIIDGIKSFSEIIENGRKYLSEKPDAVSGRLNSIDPDELCSIVYTSGTTGEAKGVMLTNRGFTTDIVSAESVLNLYSSDVFISHLPLSHLYERLAGHWTPLYKGCTIYYAESLKTVVDDMKTAKPTVMVSVPRMYEKVAQGVLDQVSKGSIIKRLIFKLAMKTGLRYAEKKQTGKPGRMLSAFYQAADSVVFSKIKEKLGGRMRSPISGGSPITVDTLKLFEAMGMKIADGYGMTETHLIITLTDAKESVYGSCGRPVPNVEVKISDEGEVLVKGKTLMKGYYNKPELTAQAIDSDGWFHTGDIGHFSEDKYLFLTDRIKNIIITSGGKNISPAPIENAIKTSRYIEDICLIGDGRKFISALVFPEFESVNAWCRENNIPFEDKKALVKNKKLNAMLQNEIERLQENFARVEKVKRFTILCEPLTVENGALTASLKIKRKIVQERYKDIISDMYKE